MGLKNITLSADAELIRLARDRAKQERTSLNETFRQWLVRYAKTGRKTTDYLSHMEKLSYVRPGRHFTRDDMNER
jgi:hypothetical protein